MQGIDLDVLLDKTVDIAANDLSLQRNSHFANVRITKEYEPGIVPVPGEPGKIQQVILNLIKNAAQAMEANTGEGRDPIILLRLADGGDHVRIEVEDNGPGIPAEVRAKIFEPFFTTKAPGVGTGLGLSVSYFIITQIHKGTMEAHSPSGKGAKFIIRLPKARVSETTDLP